MQDDGRGANVLSGDRSALSAWWRPWRLPAVVDALKSTTLSGMSSGQWHVQWLCSGQGSAGDGQAGQRDGAGDAGDVSGYNESRADRRRRADNSHPAYICPRDESYASSNWVGGGGRANSNEGGRASDLKTSATCKLYLPTISKILTKISVTFILV